MRLPLTFTGVLLAATLARAAAPALLTAAVDRWADERDHWAFTEQVREYEGDAVKQERLETYDPSRGEDRRWALLKVDGRAPTSEEWVAWDKRKNKKRWRDPKPLLEYFDFEHARLLRDEGPVALYELPLRRVAAGLVPVDKIDLQLTINKADRAVEKVDARINEPVKAALGLAQLLDFEVDVDLQPAGGAPAGPAAAKPDGTIHAVVNKFGQRIEYCWSDFRRVTPKAGPPRAALAPRP